MIFLIKVALIDSGLNIDKDLNGKCYEGVSFYKKEYCNEIICDDDIRDFNGHGTNCAKVIVDMCNDIQFYTIKIVGKGDYTSSYLLYKALAYCLNIDIKIICVSLSMIRDSDNHQIQNLLNKLRNQEKIICVSVENGKMTSFPANVPSVIGVRGRRYCNAMHYTYDDGIFCFDASPILIQNIYGKYSFFYGNSKANAVCVGYIASFLIRNPAITTVDEIQKKLIENAFSEMPELSEKDPKIEAYLKEIPIADRELFIKLVYNFNNRELKEKLRYITPIMSDETGINIVNVIDFLESVGDYLKVNIDFSKITFMKIYYLGNFIDFIRKEI